LYSDGESGKPCGTPRATVIGRDSASSIKRVEPDAVNIEMV